jgi:uncharacterized membrane protein YdjX (TVP38/TMEM64 family)
MCAYAIGKTVGYLLPGKAPGGHSKLSWFVDKYGVYLVFTAYLIPAWPLGLVSYLAGCTMLKGTKFFTAVFISGSLISIAYLFNLIPSTL